VGNRRIGWRTDVGYEPDERARELLEAARQKIYARKVGPSVDAARLVMEENLKGMPASVNVGKSTVSRHLLAPRLGNAPIIAVESINSDGTNGPAVHGEQFGEIQEHLLKVDEAVIGIGASNVENFVNLMKSYSGSHDDFDLFVVPAVPDAKQERNTISTIAALPDDIGIPKDKIRVVFNMVDPKHSVEDRFATLFNFHATHHDFILRKEATMHLHEIYAKVADSRPSIVDILSIRPTIRP